MYFILWEVQTCFLGGVNPSFQHEFIIQHIVLYGIWNQTVDLLYIQFCLGSSPSYIKITTQCNFMIKSIKSQFVYCIITITLSSSAKYSFYLFSFCCLPLVWLLNSFAKTNMLDIVGANVVSDILILIFRVKYVNISLLCLKQLIK